MIFRLWHGWTSRADADRYQQLLESVIVPGIIDRGIDGLVGIDILRRDEDVDPRRASHRARSEGAADEVEFVTLMTFDDRAAVAAFAGPDPTASVVPPAARQLLERFDEHSQHYERVARHAAS